MVRHVDAIFTQGALRPLEPMVLPEGTRVNLSMDAGTTADPVPHAGSIRTPRLANPSDAADFVLDVREAEHDAL